MPYFHNGLGGTLLQYSEVYDIDTEPRAEFGRMGLGEVKTEDVAMKNLIDRFSDQYLQPEDHTVLASVPDDMTLHEAAKWAAESIREALHVDVAFLNHTSFGSGLSKGDLEKHEFDRYMRFDNELMIAEVDTNILMRIMAMSNQHNFDKIFNRIGDFLYSSSVSISSDDIYAIVTTSWVAADFNQEKYMGMRVIFTKVPDVTTKQILLEGTERINRGSA